MREVRILLGVALILELTGCDKDLFKGTGYISVNSTPPGASVYLDDSLTDQKTNCILEDVETGKHTVSLCVGNLTAWTEEVKVKAGDTAVVNATIEVNEGVVKWVYPIGAQYLSHPAIGPSGTIYICSGGFLYALHPYSYLKWQYATDGVVRGSPVIAEDETIFFGYTKNNVFQICALNQNGGIVWEFQPDSSVNGSSPAIGQDGSIYFSVDNWLYALNREGTIKWKSAISGRGTPVIGMDGTIYVGCGGFLFAFTPNGNLKWVHEPGGAPIIGADGTLYFNYGTRLYALNPNGNCLWSSSDFSGSVSKPSIGFDGTLYFTVTDWDEEYNPLGAELYAISSSGNIQWSRDLGMVSISTPTIGADGIIYVTGCEPVYGLYAFDENGNLLWTCDGPLEYSSAALAEDGTLYINGYSQLYAIQTSSFGLASSPWPKYAHDNQNTGRASAQ